MDNILLRGEEVGKFPFPKGGFRGISFPGRNVLCSKLRKGKGLNSLPLPKGERVGEGVKRAGPFLSS
jgi:hypothetical protein